MPDIMTRFSKRLNRITGGNGIFLKHVRAQNVTIDNRSEMPGRDYRKIVSGS